jgi:hypothetical protein
MKFPNLFLSALTGCLLVGGASGAALAQDSACEGGVIQGVKIDGNVNISGNCSIQDAAILGDVIAELGIGEYVYVTRSLVEGKISITAGGGGISEVILPALDGAPRRRIDIKSITADVYVSDNVLGQGNIVVSGDFFTGGQGAPRVLIERNKVLDGSIRCVESGAQQSTTATDNIVPKGVIVCPNF